MKAIGGYFSLELPCYNEYHENAIKLNTGRNCLEYILRCRKYKKVYIPYYTCDVILEPFQKLNIEYSYYHIGEDFKIIEDINLNQGEAILYTNYWGLQSNYISLLAERYNDKLILDNTQAFYAMPVIGVDSFNTCRKFFGVPDGAYLYINANEIEGLEEDKSYDRMSSLTKRIDLSPEDGYNDFKKSSQSLKENEIKKMSKLTERLMQSINYVKVAKIRRENFEILNTTLSSSNLLDIHLLKDEVPMVYPYLIKNGILLRDYLIKNRIFVAKYWPGIEQLVDKNTMEYNFVNNLLPLPIDQRYGREDMNHIIKIILAYEQQ